MKTKKTQATNISIITLLKEDRELKENREEKKKIELYRNARVSYYLN